MSKTLSNGYKNPETKDAGWYDDLNFDIQRLNDHTHDGTDSEKIDAKNVTKSATTLSSTNWGNDLGGSRYGQEITMPSGHTFDNCVMMIYDTDGGDVIYPTIEKTGDSAFTVYVNDNTLNLKILYA